MKAAIAALGLVATLANATAFHPNHWHYRRDNSTLPGDAQTTLTVIATEVHTVTSCAPTITNCPANPTDIDQLPEADKTTYVETITRQVTTTVCPVSEAPAVSASIIASATKTGAVPTGAASEALPEGHTSAASTTEQTTTTTATTTATHTVTVDAPSATQVSPEGANGGNTGNDNSGACPPAVTVTLPASTVYVTVGGDASAPTAAPTGAVKGEDVQDEDVEDDNEVDECDEDADAEDEDEDDVDECEPEETTTLTTTTRMPYPTGNGTAPIIPGPTGFARRFRF